MLVVLCLIAAVLPWTLVEGRKAGWADTTSPGDEYVYGTIMNGGPDLGIQYAFISRFSYICCQALTCEFRRVPECFFVDIGCGQDVNSIPFQPRPLRWEVRDVEPIMRCYDTRGRGAFYSYTASLVTID